MEKKNKFVSTIGFNCNDLDHVKVAELLNGMKRGKAQYIVNAVLAYQNMPEGQKMAPMDGRVDYEAIRTFVLQVIREHEAGNGAPPVLPAQEAPADASQAVSGGSENPLDGFTEDALQEVLASLEAFRG